MSKQTPKNADQARDSYFLSVYRNVYGQWGRRPLPFPQSVFYESWELKDTRDGSTYYRWVFKLEHFIDGICKALDTIIYTLRLGRYTNYDLGRRGYEGGASITKIIKFISKQGYGKKSPKG